jgi:hypothetical protein
MDMLSVPDTLFKIVHWRWFAECRMVERAA